MTQAELELLVQDYLDNKIDSIDFVLKSDERGPELVVEEAVAQIFEPLTREDLQYQSIMQYTVNLERRIAAAFAILVRNQQTCYTVSTDAE